MRYTTRNALMKLIDTLGKQAKSPEMLREELEKAGILDIPEAPKTSLQEIEADNRRQTAKEQADREKLSRQS